MTLTLSEIAILLTVLGNLAAVIWGVFKIGKAVSRFEFIGEQQAKEIAALQKAVGKVGDILIEMAVQSTRMDDLTQRMSQAEAMIDDLRRGEGMILPLDLGKTVTSRT